MAELYYGKILITDKYIKLILNNDIFLGIIIMLVSIF